MKARFRLLKMNSRGGTFYSVDCETGKRASLGTADEYEALQIINAKNESLRQGWLNLQLGRVYLSGTDSGGRDADLAACHDCHRGLKGAGERKPVPLGKGD